MNNSIDDFIKNAQLQDMSKDQIKQKLILAGYDLNLIETHLLILPDEQNTINNNIDNVNILKNDNNNLNNNPINEKKYIKMSLIIITRIIITILLSLLIFSIFNNENLDNSELNNSTPQNLKSEQIILNETSELINKKETENKNNKSVIEKICQNPQTRDECYFNLTKISSNFSYCAKSYYPKEIFKCVNLSLNKNEIKIRFIESSIKKSI